MKSADREEKTMSEAAPRTVLVTGGSGYIAAFVIARLLDEGFNVRTTIRSLSREAEVRAALKKLIDAGDRLTFLPADLNADAGWAEAVAGCAYVQHLASPLPTTSPKNDDDLVRPARDGTLRVLKASRQAGVRRVVMTASVASIAYGHGSRAEPFTEADWTDATNRADTSPYERSKTIAEREARDWLAREGGALELVTIHPGLVLGPVLGRDFSASLEAVKKMLDGSVPVLPRFGWPLVDVRDIADLHYRAMLAEGIAGERFIGANDFWWMEQIAGVLKRRLGAKARKVPSMKVPNFVVRAIGAFDPVVRDRLFELDKYRPVSNAKARRVLGWQPRGDEEAIVATGESLIAEGIV
jgi:dihydroflavonol-4-reductase